MTKRKEGAIKGRPTQYHDEIIRKVTEKVAEGIPVVQALKDTDMPSVSRFYEILREKPHFRTVLAHAREAQVESLINMMWEEMLKADEDKIRTADLRIKTIQWLLSRYAPKQFSERVLAEIAKQPEPSVEKTPAIAWDYLSYDERETVLQLAKAAKKRQDGELIEYQEGEVTNDGTGQSAGDDQSGDHTG